ncbi:MFS transporter [Candidatus Bathyarchaeota archaeon]|nr:MFS transporter [Candidatus Bathyarchaeota archaeon]
MKLKRWEKLKNEFSFFSGNYLILIFSWILMDFAGEIPSTYFSDYILQLGGRAVSLGMITLGSMLALAVVQFPGGYLADKYGRKWLISTFTFGVALAHIFHTLAPSWHYILVGEIVRNLCLIYQPALNAMFADSLPPEKRGMGFSIVNLIMSVSTTPAPIIALLLISSFGPIGGMRVAYGIVTIFYLIAAVIRLRLKETVKHAAKLNLKEAFLSFPKSLREGVGIWRKVPASTFFLFISLLIFRFAFAMSGSFFLIYAFYVLKIGGTPNPSLPSDVDPALRLARERWGYVNIALFISMILFSIPIGRIIDKIGRRKPLIFSGIMILLAILLFIYGNYIILFISMIMFGAGQLLGFSASQALFADLVPRKLRGKATGSMNFFSYIFMAIGGLAGGLLYEISPQTPFLSTALLTGLCILTILFKVYEPEKREE